MSLTTREAYHRAIRITGESMALRRYTGVASATRAYSDHQVHGKVLSPIGADELPSGEAQQSMQILLAFSEVVESGFSIPPRQGDKIVIGEREMHIENVDDLSRRAGGQLAAYRLWVRR